MEKTDITLTTIREQLQRHIGLRLLGRSGIPAFRGIKASVPGPSIFGDLLGRAGEPQLTSDSASCAYSRSREKPQGLIFNASLQSV
jgi:hypothetical protein